MWGGSNQIYKIRNATKSAVFAATDSGPGNVNLHEAILAQHCMSKANKNEKKKTRQFLKIKRKRGEGLSGYTPAGCLLLWCWPRKCAKKKKIDTISYELKHICILLAEESHYSRNYTAHWQRGNLKPPLSPYRENYLSKLIQGCFFVLFF